MNVLTNRAWRDISSRKARTFWVVLSVGFGIFGLSTVVGVSDLLIQSLRSSYAQSHPADLIVSIEGITANGLAALQARTPGLQTVEGRQVFRTRWLVDGHWEPLNVIGVEDIHNMLLDVVYLREGQFPSHDQLLAEQSVNAIFPLNMESEVLIESQYRDRIYTLSGFVYAPSHAAATYTHESTVYTTLKNVTRLSGVEGFNVILIGLEDSTQTEAAKDRIWDELRSMDLRVLAITIQDLNQHPIQQAATVLFSILGAMGAIALVLSCFLVINTISAILIEQIPQIGIMKTIGATTAQVVRSYLALTLLYGILAAGLTLPLSAVASYYLTTRLAALASVEIGGFTAPARALFAGLLVGLLIPPIAALLPILKGARITVREAVVSHGTSLNLQRSRFNSWLVKLKWFPLLLTLSLRSALRSRGRFFLTLTSLTVAGIAFMTVFSSIISLSRTLDVVLNTYTFDLQIEFPQSVETSKAQRIAARSAAFQHIEGWLSIAASVNDAEVWITGLPVDTTMYNRNLVAGRWFSPRDSKSVVVAEAFARKQGITVGNRVVLEIGGREEEVDVIGIIRDYNYTGDMMLIPIKQLTKFVDMPGKSNYLLLKVAPDQEEKIDVLAARLYEAFSKPGMRVNINSAEQVKLQALQQFQIIYAFLIVMVALVTVVGAIGLSAILTINVMEQRREIGILRSVGATNWSIIQIFLMEGILLGFLSWILASLVSYPVAHWFNALIGETLVGLQFNFPALGIAAWLLTITLIAGLSSIGPALRAGSMRVRDLIVYE